MLVLYSIGFDYIKSHLKEQFVVKEGDTSHSSSEEEDFFLQSSSPVPKKIPNSWKLTWDAQVIQWRY